MYYGNIRHNDTNGGGFREAHLCTKLYKKKDNESFESLIRRFSKKTVQSGKLIEAKKKQYHTKELNKRGQKLKATRRELVKKQKEYLLLVRAKE